MIIKGQERELSGDSKRFEEIRKRRSCGGHGMRIVEID